MAKKLEENMTEILHVNSIDIANAQEMKMAESMRARLVLNSKKVLFVIAQYTLPTDINSCGRAPKHSCSA